MSKTRNPDALIRIEDAIKVLCRETCHPGVLCPDSYCVEMWDEFEDVERVDAVPVRHGQWLWRNYPGYQYQCDQCKRWAMYESKFCPECGALMKWWEDGDHEKAN